MGQRPHARSCAGFRSGNRVKWKNVPSTEHGGREKGAPYVGKRTDERWEVLKGRKVGTVEASALQSGRPDRSLS